MKKLLVVLSFLTVHFSHAQLDPLNIFPANTTAEQIAAVQSLVGEGIVIQNVNVQCGTDAFGNYQTDGTLLGFNEGIVLTSGSVNNCADSGQTTGSPTDEPIQYNNGAVTPTEFLDEILTLQTFGANPTSPLNDICFIQFELIPAGNEINFEYVWGSYEYPTWVCSQFNDVFGFFLSGPNPSGGFFDNQNIALIPDTGEPVSIDNVNNVNCTANDGDQCPCSMEHYVDNSTIIDSPIGYNGFTKIFTAAAPVLACETYILTLAIADLGDSSLDSGVFLGAGTLSSPAITYNTYTGLEAFGLPWSVEDCVSTNIDFILNFDANVPIDVYVSYGGTATSGIDYADLPTTITFLPGDTIETVELIPFEDGLEEGFETVQVFIEGSSFCSNLEPDTINFLIADNLELASPFPELDYCQGQSAILQVDGDGIGPLTTYSWSPAEQVINPGLQNTGSLPLNETTTFTCDVTISQGCTKSVDIIANVIDGPTGYADQTYGICIDGSISFNDFPAQSDFTYSWSPATYLDNANSATPTFTAGADQDYVLTVAHSVGCDWTYGVSVTVTELQPLTLGEDINECGSINEIIGIVAQPGWTYSWSPIEYLDNPNVSQPTVFISNDNAGTSITYQLTATDVSGCSTTGNITVSSQASLDVVAGEDVTIFFGESTDVSATGAGALGTYEWTPSDWLEDTNISSTIVTPTDTGIPSMTYIVIGTDEFGCTGQDTLTVFVAKQAIVGVPSAFSPNNDNKNDELVIYTRDVKFIDEFSVYDRWGEQIYSASGLPNEIRWDGTYDGEAQDILVFSYYIRYSGFADNDIHEITGNVTRLQ